MDLENTGMIEVPMQRKINYAALITAILAAILAVVGIVLANSADDHAGAVDKKVVALDKKSAEFAKVTIDKLNAHSVELSADATAISVLNDKVEKLESKSVVAALAKELREGKASKTSVDILREEVLLKADAKTVKRLARRLNGFNTRLTTIEGIVLPKDEPKVEAKPVEQKPEVKPVPTPAPTPQPLPAPAK